MVDFSGVDIHETTSKQILAERWESDALQYTKNIDSLDTHADMNKWIPVLQTFFPSARPLKTLDVGTGPGYLAIGLAHIGHRSAGMDLSRAMLDIAETKGAEWKVHCHWFQGDAEKLPVPANRYDAVVNRIMLWTLPQPGKAVAEWVRVLKSGGSLVIFGNDTGNEPGLRPRFKHMVRLLVSNGWRLHYRRYKYFQIIKKLPFKDANPYQIKALLDAAGLEQTRVIKLRERFDLPFYAVKGVKRLDERFSN
jgi:ubiquinone/menaquinone biosynthesis C-methylase UbiE